MLNLQLNIRPQTAKRINKILASYDDPESFAQNIIAFQISELKRGILNLQLDLQQFETQYQTPSEDFFQKFSQGELDDSEDFIVWSGLYELLLENEAQLQELS